jgi:hypothetical protein
MSAIDILAWIAAGFTIAAYEMKTMLPLRIAAIGANIFFALYGWLDDVLPIFALHALLLPFNLYRLWEILRNLGAMRRTRGTRAEFDWLRRMAIPVEYDAADYVFRKGDRPDNLYFLDSGEVRLEEIDVTLGAGEIFGEIAFFSKTKERTVSARCIQSCRILVIDEAKFLSIYQNYPVFGLAIVQLIVQRLLDGIEKRPEAYLAMRPPPHLSEPDKAPQDAARKL